MQDDTPVILVVDDDWNILKMIEINLRKEKNYDVVVATSGEGCLRVLEKNKTIKVVLLDIQMPGIDGLQALTIIKDKYPFIEVIMMSAHGTIEKCVQAMKIGAADFITKPFASDRLLVTVRNCFRQIKSDRLIAQLAGRVFISYAREDVAKAEELYDKLITAGFLPWMDIKDISAGMLWEATIENAIKDSSFFLACLSNNSINKRGLIQREIRIALQVYDGMLERDAYILPVRLEDCWVPGMLSIFQWVDYYEPDGWIRLLDALRIGMYRRLDKKIPVIAEDSGKNPQMVNADKKTTVTNAVVIYTIEEHMKGRSQKIKELIQVIQEFVLKLGSQIEVSPNKYYVAYKVAQNFLCMVVKKQKIVLYLKLNPQEIKNPPPFSRDVTEIRHYGTGNFEITIKSENDVEVAKQFIVMAYQEVGR